MPTTQAAPRFRPRCPSPPPRWPGASWPARRSARTSSNTTSTRRRSRWTPTTRLSPTGSSFVASSDFKPVIGLTTYLEPAKFLVWETEAALLHRVYVDCVVAAGGIPVLLPQVSDAYDRLVSTVDGLVLTGGADVEPARYGHEPHPATYTRPNRDAFEFGL